MRGRVCAAAGLLLMLCPVTASMARLASAAPSPLTVTVENLPQVVRVHIRADRPLPRHFIRKLGTGSGLSLALAGQLRAPQTVPIRSGGIRSVATRMRGANLSVVVDRTLPTAYRSCYHEGGRELVFEVDKETPVAQAPAAAVPAAANLPSAPPAPPVTLVASARLTPLAASSTVAVPSPTQREMPRPVMVAVAPPAVPQLPSHSDRPAVRQLMATVPGTWRVFGAEAAQAKKVTLDFVHADIQDVIKALAIQSGANILVAPSTEAKDITIGLRDVTPDQALNYIVRLAGLGYGREGNTYVVASRQQITEIFAPGTEGEILFPPADAGNKGTPGTPAAATQVVVEKTKRMSAADTISLVQKLVTGVRAEVLDANQKSIVLTGTAEQIQAAQAAIRTVDAAYPEGVGLALAATPEVEVVRTTRVLAASVVQLAQKMAPGLKVEVIAERALALTGPRPQIDLAADAIKAFDAAYPGTAAGAQDTLPARQMEMDNYCLKHVGAAEAGRILEGLMKAGMLPTVVVTVAAAPAFPQVEGQAAGSGGTTFDQRTGTDTGQALTDLLYGARNRQGAPGAGTAQASPGDAGAMPVPTAANPVVIPADAQTNTLLLIGDRGDIDKVRQALGKIDIAPAQVMIDLKVADISNTDMQRLGMTWSWSNLSVQETLPLATASAGGAASATTVPGVQLGHFGHLPVNFDATLEALVTGQKARLLANPQIAVLDGKTAMIHVGDTVRYLASRVTGLNGTTVTIGSADVGVVVQVTPRVGGENVITLDIRPKVNVITGYTETGDGGKVPNTSERSVQTVVRLHDGETLAIGGLIRDEDVTNMQRVPGLSALPLLGELFKFRSKQRTNTQLVIFITPTLVPDTN